MKRCSRCKRLKNNEEFYTSKSSKSGLEGICKSCEKKRRRKRQEHLSRYVKRYYREHKLELINFMGGKCVKCGLTLKDVDGCLGVFVIDEIIPLRTNFRFHHRKKWGNLAKKDLEKAKQLFSEGKTQLLCHNCSAVKTWKNNDYATKPL